MDTVIVLALPVLLFSGVGVIVVVGSRRARAGKKPRTGWMVAGLVGTAAVLAMGAELLLTSPVQAVRAEKTAAHFLAALARGDDGQARAAMTRELVDQEDLGAWRLHPESRWELAGRDSRRDAIRLFYLLQSGPEDRQTLYLSFEERDGNMLVSGLERVYHVPREVMALGEALVTAAAEGSDTGSSAQLEALDAEDVAALGERLRALRDRAGSGSAGTDHGERAKLEPEIASSAGTDNGERAKLEPEIASSAGTDNGEMAKLEPEIASFDTNTIVSIGRTQRDPRMRLEYEVRAAGGGAPVSFELRVVHQDGTWSATGLGL